jgi:hypothetical protein
LTEREKDTSGAGDRASSGEQALTGRAAWGVLGSAAGGHVFVLRDETQTEAGSFVESCEKFEKILPQ